MKAQYLLFIFLLLSIIAAAQGGNNIPGPQDSAYHRQRITISEPAYHLDKIRKIISEIPPNPKYTTINLDEKIYKSLTLREKFTYNTIHLEFYNYIPEKDPVYKNEDGLIFAELPELFGGRGWSSEQSDFFRDESDSVYKWMKEDIARTKRFGLNYKRILVEMDAKDMIPYLIDYYKKERKDHDILTILVSIMRRHQYTGFVTSSAERDLNEFIANDLKTSIGANKENEDKLIQWALDYVKGPSEKSSQYGSYREYMSEPPYGLAKIKKLIGTLDNSPDEDEGEEKSRPYPKAYLSLSVREKFTYHMIHAESFSQNCDMPPPIYHEEQKIFGNLPDMFGDESWSERQVKFLKTYRDSVIKFIKEDVTRTNRVGLNYKNAIVESNGIAIIPFLVEFYKKERKDHDVLTVLLLLMENNKYPEFMASISYQKLYGMKTMVDYYNRHLALNTENEDLIMQRATDFYNKWKK